MSKKTFSEHIIINISCDFITQFQYVVIIKLTQGRFARIKLNFMNKMHISRRLWLNSYYVYREKNAVKFILIIHN